MNVSTIDLQRILKTSTTGHFSLVGYEKSVRSQRLRGASAIQLTLTAQLQG